MKESPEGRSTKGPLYIFIGERHDDFANVSLADQLLKFFEAKGLKAAFYPEDDSQLKKMDRSTYPDTGICGAENLPDNWKEVATTVDNNPAHNREMHLVGNREETVFDPFLCPIAGVPSDRGNFTGATRAFSEVMKKITDPTAEGFIGINPAFLPSIESQLNKIQEAGYDIDDPKNFGHYVQSIGNYIKNADVNLLLSSAIADRMVGEIKEYQGNEDVAIILTGINHSENVATRLGISKSEMILVSNCESEYSKDGYLQDVNVLPFDVDPHTKMPAIPSVITERLAEIQKSKTTSEENKKAGVNSGEAATNLEAELSTIAGLMKENGVELEEVVNNEESESSGSFVKAEQDRKMKNSDENYKS